MLAISYMERNNIKIVYLLPSTYNSGGMERVVTNKINYLSSHSYDVYVVTTDQKGREPYFEQNKNIHQINLDINYEDNKSRNVFSKFFYYFYNQYRHWKKLSETLHKIKPQIVISTFNNELSILSKINDGSKKILEFHFCRNDNDITSPKSSFVAKVLGYIENVIYKDPIKKYDCFVLLTEEDKLNWNEYSNTIVIPNAQTFRHEERNHIREKIVMAVGRYCKVKGFDRLISAWNLIKENIAEWQLHIYGEGSLREVLQTQIDVLKLNDSIKLMGNSANIKAEYEKASLLVVTSHYEGFSMALVEGKSAGLPLISFDCPCGPKEIINNEIDGFIVKNGDIRALADKILLLIKDDKLREKMGERAFENSTFFSEDVIMKRWIDLFNSLLKKNA